MEEDEELNRRMFRLAIFIAGTSGFVGGLLSGIILDNLLPMNYRTTGKRHEKNDRNVMIIEEPMGLARIVNRNILVEHLQKSGEYISLTKYLTTMETEYDRKIEELKIKKLVGW